MAGSDENNPGVIEPGNIQGDLRGRAGKFPAVTGTNRRALSNINRNIIGGPPYPHAVNKRGLSEREAICNKIPPIPVHRPMTRKFATQIANKQQQQHEPEEIKKPLRSVPISSESEDCNIIDVEDYKTSNDFSAPMFAQHTLEEIDRMDEVEMEDVEEEPVMDIDGCDKRDPLAVMEYIDDLYNFYKKGEVTKNLSSYSISEK